MRIEWVLRLHLAIADRPSAAGKPLQENRVSAKLTTCR
jgi:hypothetical protein